MRTINPATARALAAAAAGLAAATTLIGCAYDEPNSPQYDAMRDNLTPELDTLAMRPDDVDNTLVRSADVYGRLFWEDLGRLGLLDRPSRLSDSHIVE
jgi:hypothetical protein